ncbi:MAG TPA: hypothetical protein VKR54_02160 [Candidatus Babeliales bacterium]|jgi:hypothetical protein|nr:hypothetical protein [Candidatus Babeliales bacterium]
MKSTHVVSLFLVISTAIHAMENNQLVDYKAIHQLLRDDYKNYAINRLKEYKKSDSLDMNQLIEVGNIMTKSKDVIQQLLHWDIKDEDKNCFIHIATKKSDVPLVEWLLMQGDKNCVYVNADQEYPLDICIKQLLPTVIDSGTKSRQIFDLMVPHIAKLSEYDEFKQLCLKKIIALHLKHKRCNSNFAIDKELLQSLVPKTLLEQQPPILSIIYKETIDETDGSTLSHILVEQENPDELYELAKADQISWLKNNNGLTSFDIAAARFREAIQDIALVGANAESITKRGCCLYILMHYLRNAEIKNGTIDVQNLGHCCTKHVLQ